MSRRLRLVAATTRTLDDADVTRSAPTFCSSPVFKESQQQPLHPQGHLADLVEEHGAFVRDLELACFVSIGAGEASLRVPEELGFQECVRQTRAVHRHERSLSSRASVVNGSGCQLLSGAALSGDQHL